MSEKIPPTPAEVDELALEMLEIRGKLAEIDADATTRSTPLLDRALELKNKAEGLVRQFGSVHADKSKLLHGVAYEIMGTFGTKTTTDAAAVEVFRLALVKAKQERVLKKIFEKSIRWTLVAGWSEMVRGAKLPAKLLALFASCQVTSDRAAIITPREKPKTV